MNMDLIRSMLDTLQYLVGLLGFAWDTLMWARTPEAKQMMVAMLD